MLGGGINWLFTTKENFAYGSQVEQKRYGEMLQCSILSCSSYCSKMNQLACARRREGTK
jgi:hypothetical protein